MDLADAENVVDMDVVDVAVVNLFGAAADVVDAAAANVIDIGVDVVDGVDISFFAEYSTSSSCFSDVSTVST